MLQEYARTVPGNSVEGVRRGLEFAEAFQAAGAATLGGPELLKRVRGQPGSDERTQWAYLAHEYLNAHWQPLLHADVARDMAAAKLTYAGAAHIFQNEPALILNPAQRALLAGIPDPMLRETFADYCGQEGHRCDVFVRGRRTLSPRQLDARLRAMGLAQIAPISLPFTIQGPGAPVVLEERVYAPILATLAEAPRRVGDLLDLPAVRAARQDGPPPSPRELILNLTGIGAAIPVTGGMDGSLPSVLRFNRLQAAEAVTKEVMDRGARIHLAASVGGAGLTVGAAEAMLFHGLQTGAPAEPALLLDHCLGPLQVASFLGDPVRLQAEAQRRFELLTDVELAQRVSLPVWRRLGMI
jgi:hypothetical protein